MAPIDEVEIGRGKSVSAKASVNGVAVGRTVEHIPVVVIDKEDIDHQHRVDFPGQEVEVKQEVLSELQSQVI